MGQTFAICLDRWIDLISVKHPAFDAPSFPFPQVTIDNATPCLLVDKKPVSVDNFEEGTPQYICGDMVTDTSPVDLTLLIYTSDIYLKSKYVTSSDFEQGDIIFTTDPPLSPGKYRALIMYARTTFAYILRCEGKVGILQSADTSKQYLLNIDYSCKTVFS